MDREQRSELAARIAEVRKRMGLSQQDLADQANTSRRTIGSIERGDTVPQRGILDRVLAVLGLNVAEEDLPPDVRSFLAMLGPLLERVDPDERAQLMPEIVKLVVASIAPREAEVARGQFGAGRRQNEMAEVLDEAAWDEGDD